MEREETKKLIMAIVATFPNYKPADFGVTIDVWTAMLSERSYEEMQLALKSYILTDRSGFAPSIGQLIEKANNLVQKEQLTEMQAWSMVSKAIRNAGYNSVSEFEKFPPAVQKAVGSPENLRAWALDSNYNENVTQSHFINCYKTVLKRESEKVSLSSDLRNLIESKQVNGNLLIGDMTK